MHDVESIVGTRLGPGTLYGAIERLEADGLIEALPGEDRRVPYRLTPDGERHLSSRLRDLRQVISVAVARLGM
jgi:DNA-binding PadR family transcriptional regulator